jgi:hypothetical protein
VSDVTSFDYVKVRVELNIHLFHVQNLLISEICREPRRFTCLCPLSLQACSNRQLQLYSSIISFDNTQNACRFLQYPPIFSQPPSLLMFPLIEPLSSLIASTIKMALLNNQVCELQNLCQGSVLNRISSEFCQTSFGLKSLSYET